MENAGDDEVAEGGHDPALDEGGAEEGEEEGEGASEEDEKEEGGDEEGGAGTSPRKYYQDFKITAQR